ncbi:MAG: metal-sensing transcriptional repressor [Rhodocyclaceae bacterium]|nr:metal-sensing transcriptional repressor [Rhodocyclaceae bacterium]
MDAETIKARKKALCARLARIEGQIRGLQKLINLQAEPEKISQQMAAARKALDKAFFAMVADLMASDQITPTDAADLLLRFA